MKKLLSLLLCILVLCSFTGGISTVSAATVIEVNSAKGGNFADAVSRLRNTGGTVRLIGTFKVSSDVKVYSNTIIDARKATVNSTSTYALDVYQSSNVVVIGGKWNVKNGFVKFSRCNNCTVKDATVDGGVTKLSGSGYNDDYFCKRASVICVKSNKVLIKNCSFSHLDSDSVNVYDAEQVTVANCNINKCWGHGIHYYKSDNPVIIHNNIKNICGDGIYCSNLKNARISGNTLVKITKNHNMEIDPTHNYESRSGAGVMMSYTESSYIGFPYTFEGKTYKSNTYNDIENYAIPLNICNKTKISNENIKNTRCNAIHSSASANTVITNCNISNIKGSGIAFVTGSLSSLPLANKQSLNGVVFNNRINGCTEMGVWSKGTRNTKILHNIILNAVESGVQLHTATNNIISGNTITTPIKKGKVSTRGIFTCVNTKNVKIGVTYSYGGKKYGKNTLYGSGIKIQDTVGYSVKNNDIKPCSGMKKLEGMGISIANGKGSGYVGYNKISSPMDNGIYAVGATGLTIEKNTVSNPSNFGIGDYDSISTKLLYNKVLNSKKHGIYVSGSTGTVVEKNTVTSPKESGITIGKKSKNVVVKSNTISKPGKAR